MSENRNHRGLTRRTFVGGASVLAMSAFTMGLAGCMPKGAATATTTEPSFRPGTYTATAMGRNGDGEVQVTLSDSAITAVEVGENYETIGVGQRALETVPGAVVEAQSLAVDAVSGATLTSQAILNAASECVKQAGGDVKQLQKAAAEPAAGQRIEKTADVVVGGGGGTGCRAAIAAAEQGASVVIIEKADYFGGNTCVSGGIYNAADPDAQAGLEMTDSLRAVVEDALAEPAVDEQHGRLQAAVKDDYEAYRGAGGAGLFDSPAWHALQTYNGGDKLGNVDLILALTTNALDSLTGIKELGIEYKPEVKQGGGALWQRTHYTAKPLGSGYIAVYEQLIEHYGDLVEVVWSAEATELVKDGSRVAGVKARDLDGNDYVVHANNGVVMATGGFASNVAMRQQYCESDKWSDLGTALHTTNMGRDDGSGTLMAQAAGADLVNMDQIQLLHSCCARNGDADWGLKYSVNTSIFVNKDGERFVKEDGRRDELCLAIFEQPDKFMYIVQSGDTYPNAEELVMNDGVPIAESIATGDVFVGDSAEDLAAQLSMAPDVLQKTIDEYNAAVDSGDDAFGRALLSTKLEKGPWYAMKRAPAAHFTMGGIRIDTDCHALDEHGAVVEGLYAAGECAGGIHGGNRLGGNAVAATVILGQIARPTAAPQA